MKRLFYCLLLVSPAAFASIMGVSTHPVSSEARVLSAAMTGYMSQRHEVGAGLRYTHGVEGVLFDASIAGAQDSRNVQYGMGADISLLSEEMDRPRVAMKPFFQHQNIDGLSSTLIGVAPSLRKGVPLSGLEFFPYLALPNGFIVDGETQELSFSSALTLGTSLAIPRSQEALVVSLEANKSLGGSSDSIAALISWVWR